MKEHWGGSFVRRVAMLVGGTLLSQVVHYLTLPYITRLYTPGHFSEYAKFITASSIVGSAASLRYEIQIPIARHKREALALLVISVACSTILGLLSSCAVLLAMGTVYGHVSLGITMVPLAMTMAGMQSAFGYWAVRSKDYRWIAKTNVSRAVVGAGIQSIGGWLDPSFIALAVGLIVKNSLGFVFYGWQTLRSHARSLSSLTWRRVLAVAVIHRRQPFYSTLETLANTTAANVPILVGTTFALGDQLGQILLALQLLQAPAGLIGSSISQVYLSEGGTRYRDGTLVEYTYWIILRIAMITVPPMVIILGFWNQEIFRLAFGTQWAQAATYARILAPSILLQLMVSPISTALQITQCQRIAFLLQVGGLIWRSALMTSGILISGKAAAMPAYAIANAGFYATYLVVVMLAVGAGLAKIVKVFLILAALFCASAAVGFLSKSTFHL